MTTLSVNGIEMGPYIQKGSLAQTNREIGSGLSFAYDGTGRKSRVVIKRDISFDTIPLSLADANAFEGLFCGLGHHWTFAYGASGLCSSKGFPPTAGYAASIVDAAGAVGVNGYLHVNATTGTITWSPYPVGSVGWTVSLWRSSGGAYDHYVVSGTRKWLNGVRADGTSTTFLTADATSFTLAETGAAYRYDEVDFVPYAMPTAWPPLIYTAGADPPFGNAPALYVRGNFVTNMATRTMMGSVSSREMRCVLAGSVQNALVLAVTLEEV